MENGEKRIGYKIKVVRHMSALWDNDITESVIKKKLQEYGSFNRKGNEI